MDANKNIPTLPSLGGVADEKALEALLESIRVPERQAPDPGNAWLDPENVRAVAESALRRPRIVIIGPANSGKSTFINLLFGANVSEVRNQAGSTDQVATEVHDALGVVLVDTPGLNISDLDDAKAVSALESADLLILMFDVTNLAGGRDLWRRFGRGQIPVVPMFNKADMMTREALVEVAGDLDRWDVPEPRLYASVLTGWNLSPVLRAICDKLPLECRPAFIGWLSDELQAARQLREQIREEARRRFEAAKTDSDRRAARKWEEEATAQVEARASEIAVESRDNEADEIILKYAAIASGSAIIPFPLVDIPVAVAAQIRMVTAIAAVYGHKGGVAYIKSAFGTIFAQLVVRKVLTGLLKLIPLAGEVIDAAVTFAATYALGKTAKAHFRGDLAPGEFNSFFDRMKDESKRKYQV